MSNKVAYTLTVSPEQAHVLTKALDFYARMGMGQLEEVNNVLQALHPDNFFNLDCKLRADLMEAKSDHFNFLPGGSYGIGNPKVPAECKTAYDLECVIRQAIAKQENHGSHSVWHHDPLHYNREVPLAAISVEVKTESEIEYDTMKARIWAAARKQKIASADQCQLDFVEHESIDNCCWARFYNKMSDCTFEYYFDLKSDTLFPASGRFLNRS